MESSPQGTVKWLEGDLTLLEEAALAVAQATIQNAINETSINRAELARRMGCSRSFVTRILQGDHNLTVKTLARALGVCGRQMQLDATAPQCSWAVEVSLSQPAMKKSSVRVNLPNLDLAA